MKRYLLVGIVLIMTVVCVYVFFAEVYFDPTNYTEEELFEIMSIIEEYIQNPSAWANETQEENPIS